MLCIVSPQPPPRHVIFCKTVQLLITGTIQVITINIITNKREEKKAPVACRQVKGGNSYRCHIWRRWGLSWCTCLSQHSPLSLQTPSVPCNRPPSAPWAAWPLNTLSPEYTVHLASPGPGTSDHLSATQGNHMVKVLTHSTSSFWSRYIRPPFLTQGNHIVKVLTVHTATVHLACPGKGET